MPERPSRRPARARLLEAADRLFYEEGVHSTGIDRVIAEAGAAKGSLYYGFGGKDGLVRAYLDERGGRWRAYMAEQLAARWDDPRDRVAGAFEVLAEAVRDDGFNGCPYINACAESPPAGVVRDATDDHRAWVRDLFAGLARDAGLAEPEGLAAQLALLYDGVMVAGGLDAGGDPGAAGVRAARALVEAATP